MVGKYKLIGGIAGAAAASYGGYEAYSYFKPTVATASKLVDAVEDEELIDEETEVEPNREGITEAKPTPDLLNQEAQPEEVREGSVSLKPETPKPEEKVDPKVPAAPAPVEPNPKTQPSSNKSSADAEKERRIQQLFYNNDGTLKIYSNTLGSKYQNYLITTSKDDPIWTSRIKNWEDDLKYHEDGKTTMRSLRNPVPPEFRLSRTEKVVNVESLQQRCSRAYRKKS